MAPIIFYTLAAIPIYPNDLTRPAGTGDDRLETQLKVRVTPCFLPAGRVGPVVNLPVGQTRSSVATALW